MAFARKAQDQFDATWAIAEPGYCWSHGVPTAKPGSSVTVLQDRTRYSDCSGDRSDDREYNMWRFTEHAFVLLCRALSRAAKRGLLNLENCTPDCSVVASVASLIWSMLKRSVSSCPGLSHRFLPFQKARKVAVWCHEPPMLPMKCFSFIRRSTALISSLGGGTPDDTALPPLAPK